MISYSERFNADILAYIIKNKDDYNFHHTMDDDYSPFLVPEKYLKQSDNGNIKTIYKYARGKKNGRMYAEKSLSLQSFSKKIRHSISSELYDDIDIVNCHPVLLYHLCKNNNIKCDKLIQYTKSRDNIINDVLDVNNKLSRDDIKIAILSLMNGGAGNYKKIKNKTKFLNAFKREIDGILQSISELKKDEYKKFVPKNDYNKLGCFVNSQLCPIENTILQEMAKHFKVKQDDDVVLCFDGLMIPKNKIKSKDIRQCEKHILDKLGYTIKLKVKPMDDGFDIPEDIEKFDPSTFNWSFDTNDSISLLAGSFSDVDVADYFYSIFGNDFVLYADYIYHWNGDYWVKDTEADCIHNIISRDLFKILKKAADDKWNNNTEEDLKIYQKVLKKLLKLRNNISKKGIVEEIKLLIKTKEDQFDLNPDLLGFKNGMYDLKNMVFRKAERTDYVSLIINYNYSTVSDEDMVKLNQFINQVLPVEEERSFILKALSSCLGGRTLENFLIFTGEGRNGKDTLISYLMKETLGRNLFYYNSNSVITGNNSSGANQEKCNMDKRRCVVYSEPNKDCNLKNNTLKELSGGKQINARGLYSKNTETILHCTNIILCNDIPSLDNVDNAISKRLIVAEFRSLFLTTDEIKKLPVDTPHLYEVNTYYKENEFILNSRLPFLHLLLEYYVQFKSEGYVLKNLPKSISDMSKAYLSESDDFLNWFNEQYTKTESLNDHVSMKDIYDDFRCSELYSNLTKREKRAMNKKKLTDTIAKNPNLRVLYKKRKKIKGVDYCSIILGYKINTVDYVEDNDY